MTRLATPAVRAELFGAPVFLFGSGGNGRASDTLDADGEMVDRA